MSNAPEPTAATVASQEGGTTPQPELSAELRKASESVSPAGPAKRQPGKRGPDKQPRRRRAVPVAEMAGGSPGPLLGTSRPPLAIPVEFDAGPPAGAVALEKMVAAIITSLDKTLSAGFYLLAQSWTKDDQIAEAARKAVALDQEEKDGLTAGGAYVWEKYFGTVTDPRELAFYICAGGVLIKSAGALVHLAKAKRDHEKEQLANPPQNLN